MSLDTDDTNHSIYEIIDPRDNSVFYVGASKNPDRRYKQHLKGDSNQEKTARIQDLQKIHLLPVMNIIETVKGTWEARNREKYWISVRIEQGHPLTNKPNVIEQMWANFDFDTHTENTDTSTSSYVDTRRLKR